MRKPAASEKLIEELIDLVDDGTITDDERSMVTQAIESTAMSDENSLGLIEKLQAAMQADWLPGEERAVDKTLVQTIVKKLQDHSPEKQTLPAAAQDDGGSFPSEAEDNLAGQTVGNYRILQLIGRGGMGAVYEATDQLLHRHVALKIMLPEVAVRVQNRNRFLREARAAASVEHDHICPIYQVGDDHGTPFIAMPLLVGETLESRIRSRRLTYLETIEVMEQVAKGLQAAHQIGLIHRDVKPANVWLEKRKEGPERVRLLDFGLAQMETEEPGLTQPGSVMGTPSYMSPEQARGEAVDARTDLFSAGAMLYELLTGTKPFAGKTPTSVISSILVDTPATPISVDADCPKELSELAMRLLQKDPRQRLTSAVELQRTLADCRNLLTQTIEISANQGNLRTAADLHSSQTQPALLPASFAQRTRTTWLWPSLIALGLSGLALAGVLIFQTSAGTLVVEASDDSKVIFEKGELQVLDDSGKIAYRLSAQSPSQKVRPGKYQVRVTGADGLTLNTSEFTIHRNENTILRVSAQAPQQKKSARAEASMDLTTRQVFRGRAIFDTDFKEPSQWPLPLVDESSTVSMIENERLIYQQRQHNPANPFLTIPLVAKLNRGAFAMRCKTLNGAVFFNFCVRNDDTRSRALSLGISEGSWTLYIQRFDLSDKKWKVVKATVVAASTILQPGLAKDEWLDIAFRWSEKDYGLWMDGEPVAGGTLPSDELTIGQPQPMQIGLRTSPEHLPQIEIDSIGLWDQSDVALEESKIYTPRK